MAAVNSAGAENGARYSNGSLKAARAVEGELHTLLKGGVNAKISAFERMGAGRATERIGTGSRIGNERRRGNSGEKPRDGREGEGPTPARFVEDMQAIIDRMDAAVSDAALGLSVGEEITKEDHVDLEGLLEEVVMREIDENGDVGSAEMEMKMKMKIKMEPIEQESAALSESNDEHMRAIMHKMNSIISRLDAEEEQQEVVSVQVESSPSGAFRHWRLATNNWRLGFANYIGKKLVVGDQMLG